MVLSTRTVREGLVREACCWSAGTSRGEATLLKVAEAPPQPPRQEQLLHTPVNQAAR